MRKKNGFTLVELLAVIVVLALIMVIAIPSVLDTMNSARRQAFIEYAMKMVNSVTNAYVTDSQSKIPGAGIYIYDIKTDLGLTSHGNYDGYILIDAKTYGVDKPHYVIYLKDPNYQIINWDVQAFGDYPNAEDDNDYFSQYDETDFDTRMSTPYRVCKDYIDNLQNISEDAKDKLKCMNRNNYIIAEA